MIATSIRLPLLLAVLACGCQDTNKVPPEVAAKKYVTDLKMAVQGISCTSVDTNNDGYVTCSLSMTPKEGEQPQIQTIQCAAVGGNAGGCKP
jgi:hypothetical protein